jgi:transposase
MLTKMSDADWAIVVEAFRAARSRRGDKGRDDRKFLEALHYFTVHNITWRALPAEFGNWNSVWKRFWRLSQRGVFEALLANLAQTSGTAHLVQMVDSTVVRAHVSAAGAKGAGKPGPRALAWRVFLQNPPENRFRRLAARLPSDRRRGQRQPQF